MANFVGRSRFCYRAQDAAVNRCEQRVAQRHQLRDDGTPLHADVNSARFAQARERVQEIA
jgi:hypothetical protein